MKKTLSFIVMILSAQVASADLKVRSAICSSKDSNTQKIRAADFGLADTTHVNYYQVSEGALVSHMCSGMDIRVVDLNNQPVNAELRIDTASFTVYYNNAQFKKTNMTLFIPPSGGGSPSIAMYDKSGTRVTTKDYQSVIGNITGSRLVIAEHVFAIGPQFPKFPQLENRPGSSYVISYSMTGAYKPEGASEFIPFNLIPGDEQSSIPIQGTVYNYSTIMIGGKSREEWIALLESRAVFDSNGKKFTLHNPESSTFPGGHYVSGGQTSTDLQTWTDLTLQKVDENNWTTSYFNDNRRFFRVKVGTRRQFTE